METFKLFIHPEMAKGLLVKNTNNRTLNKSIVSKYARDMVNGAWLMTHQGILLGKDDIVIDGQHRLHAVVKSGCGQWFLVSRDEKLIAASDLPLDIGDKRSSSYILGKSNQLVAVANFVYATINGSKSTSPNDIKPYINLVEKPFASFAKITGRKLSSAPLATAAVLRVMMDVKDTEYVNNAYTSMCASKFKEMPPICESFYKQVIVENIAFDSRQLFSRGFRIFDKLNSNRARLQVRDEIIAYNEAKDALKKYLSC